MFLLYILRCLTISKLWSVILHILIACFSLYVDVTIKRNDLPACIPMLHVSHFAMTIRSVDLTACISLMHISHCTLPWPCFSLCVDLTIKCVDNPACMFLFCCLSLAICWTEHQAKWSLCLHLILASFSLYVALNIQRVHLPACMSLYVCFSLYDTLTIKRNDLLLSFVCIWAYICLFYRTNIYKPMYDVKQKGKNG